MALIFKDRIKETSVSVGIGNFVFAGPVIGFQSFGSQADFLVPGNTFYYAIDNSAAGEWEVGLGHLLSSTTMVRDSVLTSSDAGSFVNFSAGTKTVFNTAPAGWYNSPAGDISSSSATSTDSTTHTIAQWLQGGPRTLSYGGDASLGNVTATAGPTKTLAAWQANGPVDASSTTVTATAGPTKTLAAWLASGPVDASGTNVTATAGPTKTLAAWFASGPVDATATTATATGSSAARTLAAWFGDVVNVKAFGAIGNNVADDTAAINAAIAYANTHTPCTLYFPPGYYKLTATLTTISNHRIHLLGAGSGQSILFQYNDVDTLTVQLPVGIIEGINISNLSIDYGFSLNPSASVALKLIRCKRFVGQDLQLRNVFAGLQIYGGQSYWLNQIHFDVYQSWTTFKANSVLLLIQHHVATNEVPTEIFISDFNIKGYGPLGGPLYLDRCLYIQACDGLFMSNGHCGFAHNQNLLIAPQNNAALYIANLSFNNVYFDGENEGVASGSILFSGSTTSQLAHIHFVGCTIKSWIGHGIHNILTSLTDLRVIGCTITNNGGFGVNLAAAATDVLISGNVFQANTAGAVNVVAGTTGRIVDNVGYNPVGPGAITVTASPFTYTAGRSPETVYITGGTVSAIAVNGTTVFSATEKTVQLGPGETTTVTYTVAPTMTKMVH